MPTLSDARFDALRGLGYQGSTSDMLLEWLIDSSVVDNVTFATLDPNNKATIMQLSEGNLRCVSNSTAGRGVAFGNLGKSTGKWYWEALSLSAVTAQGVGIGTAGTNINEYLGESAFCWGYFPTGAYWTNATNIGTGQPWGTNSILGFALDLAGDFNVYVNGVLGLTVPHNLTGPVFPGLSDSSAGGVCDFMMNFGQDSTFGGRVTAQNNPDENGIGDFYYAPPAGFLTIRDSGTMAVGDQSTISDAWRRMLLSRSGLPVATYHRNDYWYVYLGALGYTGSMNDRELAFWLNGGTFEPTTAFDNGFDEGYA